MTDSQSAETKTIFLSLFLGRTIGENERAFMFEEELERRCSCIGSVNGQHWECTNPPEYKVVELLDRDDDGPGDSISVGLLSHECFSRVGVGAHLLNGEGRHVERARVPIALLVLPPRLSRRRVNALRAQINERSIRATRKGGTKAQ